MPPNPSCPSPDAMPTPLDSELKFLNLAVVGHQEWVTFLEVDALPRPGRIGRASRDLEEPAGAGAVIAVQLARLTGQRVLFSQRSVVMQSANAANNASESWELNPWWPGATNPVGAESA